MFSSVYMQTLQVILEQENEPLRFICSHLLTDSLKNFHYPSLVRSMVSVGMWFKGAGNIHIGNRFFHLQVSSSVPGWMRNDLKLLASNDLNES